VDCTWSLAERPNGASRPAGRLSRQHRTVPGLDGTVIARADTTASPTRASQSLGGHLASQPARIVPTFRPGSDATGATGRVSISPLSTHRLGSFRPCGRDRRPGLAARVIRSRREARGQRIMPPWSDAHGRPKPPSARKFHRRQLKGAAQQADRLVGLLRALQRRPV
jgi:hypothetical protein